MKGLPSRDRRLFQNIPTAADSAGTTEAEAQTTELYTNMQQLHSAGDELLSALRKYKPAAGDKILLDDSSSVCANRLFHVTDYLTYTQFVEVVDRLAALRAQQAAATWELTRSRPVGRALSSTVHAGKNNTLWEAIKAGLGLVTIFVTSKLVNAMNSPGNNMLIPPADAWFDSDALVGIAIYLLLTGNIQDLPLLKGIHPGLYKKVVQVQERGPELVLKEAGIDPSKLRSSMEADDLLCLYRYALDYIQAQEDPSVFDHWLTYARTAHIQGQMKLWLDLRAPADSRLKPVPIKSGPYKHYLYHFYQQTLRYYYSVPGSFALPNSFVQICCLAEALGEKVDELGIASELDKLAKLLFFASLTSRSHRNILINYLKQAFEGIATNLLLRVADELDSVLSEAEEHVRQAYYDIDVLVRRCLGLDAISNFTGEAVGALYRLVNGVLMELDSRLPPHAEVDQQIQTNSKLLKIAALLRALAEQPRSFWELCRTRPEAAQSAIRDLSGYPQLVVDTFLTLLPKRR